MAIQTFTAGQVLTAAQVNALQANDYNQTVSTKTGDYVLVAADKGTRVVMNSASAQTITVNTSLFSAGDTLFIQNIGAGICTITAGTATVSTAGSLALPQNAGGTLYFTSAGVSIFFPTVATSGATGLTLIKTQTIGSAVSSVNVTGAFSTTYDAYKIILSGGVGSASHNLALQLGATVTGYYAGYVNVNYSTGSVTGDRDNNAASFTLAGYGTANVLNLNADLQNPFTAKNTTFQTFNSLTTTGAGARYGSGYLANTTSYTDFTLTPSTGTLTGGTIRVYGYNN
jgi:hypothetical protein